jgi:anti-sigma factor RsiW
MMECQDCEKYLFPFLDEALDIKQTLDMQAHVDTCARCAERVQIERTLKAFVRQHAMVPPLPEDRKRQIIRSAMGLAPVSCWWKRWKVVAHLRDAAIGAAAAAAVLSLALRLLSPLPPTRDMVQTLSQEVSMTYRAHMSQSLPLAEMQSDDTAAVAWVRSHMGAGIEVPWITENQMRFLGGRLCRILDRKSAVLVYRRHDAEVLLFAFKGEPLTSSGGKTVRAAGHTFYLPTVSGRPIVLWQHHGTTYSLVGNLSRDALVQLASAIAYR